MNLVVLAVIVMCSYYRIIHALRNLLALIVEP